MARKPAKKYEEEDLEEEFEDDSDEEDAEEEESEEDDGLPPIAPKKKSLKKSSPEPEVRYFPKAVSLQEMANENYVSSQENKQIGKEILMKLDKVLNSIE